MMNRAEFHFPDESVNMTTEQGGNNNKFAELRNALLLLLQRHKITLLNTMESYNGRGEAVRRYP